MWIKLTSLDGTLIYYNMNNLLRIYEAQHAGKVCSRLCTEGSTYIVKEIPAQIVDLVRIEKEKA